MKITPEHSVLPNSPHTVGREQPTPYGAFQVDWVPAIDMHVLMYNGPAFGGTICLAAHHNGYSCQEIIDRVTKGDIQSVKDQLQYILVCGGLGKRDTAFDHIMKIPSSTPQA